MRVQCKPFRGGEFKQRSDRLKVSHAVVQGRTFRQNGKLLESGSS